MNNDLNILYKDHPQLNELKKLINDNVIKTFHLKGLTGSSCSLLVSQLINNNRLNLIILNDKEEAAYFYDDLININHHKEILFFPSSYKRSIQYYQPENENIVLRTEVLNKIASYNLNNKNKYITIITYPEALCEKAISNVQLQKSTLKLKVGEHISIDFIYEVLDEYQFQRVDFVYEPGQYSIRGSIVDIFSFSSEIPYRIDFFGNEVETIRTFNIDTQLSINKLNKITITPNIQDLKIAGELISFLDYIPTNSLFFLKNTALISSKIEEIYVNTNFNEINELIDIGLKNKNEIIISKNIFEEQLKRFQCIEFSHQHYFNPEKIFSFNTSPQPNINKNFELLVEKLIQFKDQEYENFIFSENQNQLNRLTEIIHEINKDAEFIPFLKVLHQGFTDHDLKICCYTDHQIFDRYHKYKVKNSFSNKGALTLKELTGLNPGDYVVHIDHGIGKFGGLEKIEVNGKMQESVRLIYKDNDILYVSIHSLHRISKYKGKEGTPVKIYKLGSGAWQKLKQKTKNKVKDIAKELITLYAKRKEEKGFRFSPDSYLQQELEASFIYEDTPDQEKATRSVKENMESAIPMDMLVCGDVGFGKTEVAIRAAFKAVADSKQVAVLVPTTILALQHYTTFTERLDKFPCTIDFISRLKSYKKQKEIIEKLKYGKIDIIIGTHRLVGNDVKFKDLGLLIIDEEQKFGVSVKEKLKKIKINVDTLTLTATPIPRTLQFSLMGARDLAIINTPPPNRQPILTELHSFNEEIIREAILYEVNRNGQVFFIHNLVQNIIEIENLINKITPGVTTAVAHGQLEPAKLEKVILDYIAGKYDVLVSTAIIESGLDIPNSNTIIVNNAHHFGLSDLHQLRGRVGRSNKKAFCYLLTPPLSSLTPEARRRLKAIEDFSDLGSGFNIALQDLDIRGAGNLLGAEQSGFIADIGFEAYHQILNEAMQELKENDFPELFKPDKKAEKQNYLTDCQIDTDFELHFPEEYIDNTSERIKLYRELDNINDEHELVAFKDRLTDRFGKMPKQTEDLIKVVQLRWNAMKLGFEKIILKNKLMIIYFISNPLSPYYQSKIFGNIINYIQQQTEKFKMKEEKNKLNLIIENINNIEEAFNTINIIKNNIV